MRQTTALLAMALMGATGCSDDDIESLLGIDMYFVKLSSEPSEVANTVTDISELFGLNVVHTYDSATEGFSAKLPEALVPELRELDEVEYIKRDDKVHGLPPEENPREADPIEVGDDEVPESLLRIGAPYLGGGLNGIHVAVVDTGIDGSHPDLNVVAEIDIAGLSGAGTPINGEDLNGHGTHCAGTIGAIADGEGVVGVAPGVPLHAVRVLGDDGSGYWSDIVAGLEYVLENPEIRVVNMSLGGPAFPDGDPDPLRDAIQKLEDAGVVVVIAAGNEEDDADNHSPANYDLGVVVSAYDAAGLTDNGFAWFSNYGDQVDISAPGVDILSTYPGGTWTLLSGTSMATPAVAGAAAAFLAENPNAQITRVRNELIDSGENNYQGQNNRHPEPLLDVEALLN